MKARLNKPGFFKRLSENLYRQSEKYDKIGRMMYFREVGRLEGRKMKLEEEIKCKKIRRLYVPKPEHVNCRCRIDPIESEENND